MTQQFTIHTARQLFANGEYQHALTCCHLLEQAGQTELELYEIAGQSLLALGDTDAAINCYGQLIHKDFLNVTHYLTMARLYQSAGQPHHALVALVFADSVAGGDTDIQQRISQLLQQHGKHTIKICFLYSQRLGHLAVEPHVWLRQRLLHPPDDDAVLYLFLHPTYVSNKQILTMLQRHIHTVAEDFLYRLFLERPGLFNLDYYARMPGNWHDTVLGAEAKFGEFIPSEVYEKTDSVLCLNEEEQTRGAALLRQMGIDLAHDWYVCLYIRDSAFLHSLNPNMAWHNLDFRDAEINDYQQAVAWIIEQGGYVIRVGAKGLKPLNVASDKVIDYTFDWREHLDGEFMDVFLALNCRFLIGSYSGFSDMALSLDVPTVCVNAAPPHPTFGKHSMYMPKLVKRRTNGDWYRFADLYKNATEVAVDQDSILFCPGGDALPKLDAEFIDNEPSDILQAVQDFFHWQANGYAFDEAQQTLLKQYFALLPTNHFLGQNRTPVSPGFVAKYKMLF